MSLPVRGKVSAHITPRHIPQRMYAPVVQPLTLAQHRPSQGVIAAGMKRMTSQESPHHQPQRLEKTVLFKSADRIRGAAWGKTAL